MTQETSHRPPPPALRQVSPEASLAAVVAPPAMSHQGQVPVADIRPPPHPLDASWYLHADERVLGPYTGHQIGTYFKEGRIEAGSLVARLGSSDWKRVADDEVLRRFVPAVPVPGSSTVHAERGAAVVQVVNQAPPQPRPIHITLPEIESGSGPKSPALAAVLSFFCCGLGQLYNGDILRGIFMFFGCLLFWTFAMGWIFNFWSIGDAYGRAKKINAEAAAWA